MVVATIITLLLFDALQYLLAVVSSKYNVIIPITAQTIIAIIYMSALRD